MNVSLYLWRSQDKPWFSIPYESGDWTPGHQAWQQASFPAEPSRWPSILYLMIRLSRWENISLTQVHIHGSGFQVKNGPESFFSYLSHNAYCRRGIWVESKTQPLIKISNNEYAPVAIQKIDDTGCFSREYFITRSVTLSKQDALWITASSSGWWGQSFLPCLPPSQGCPWNCWQWVIGMAWHYCANKITVTSSRGRREQVLAGVIRRENYYHPFCKHVVAPRFQLWLGALGVSVIEADILYWASTKCHWPGGLKERDFISHLSEGWEAQAQGAGKGVFLSLAGGWCHKVPTSLSVHLCADRWLPLKGTSALLTPQSGIVIYKVQLSRAT